MNSRWKIVLLLALSGKALAQPKPTATQKLDAPSSVAIVELFTSEGCSSCPPADELLQRINFTTSSAGQLVIGLSEHVTYWNHLGWRDPYSQDAFTERQNRYALRFSLEGPYTPQMVLNGRSQFVGSDANALQTALHRDEEREQLHLALSAATPRGDGLDLHFSLKSANARPVEVYAALTDDLDRSDVLRGENSGRILRHAAVVRSLTRVVVTNGNTSQYIAHVSFPPQFERDGSPGHHVVLFAQEPHQGAILGAAALGL